MNTQLVLADRNNLTWIVTVADDGTLNPPVQADLGTYAFTLALFDVNGIAWLLSIDNEGNLITEIIPTLYAYQSLMLAAPDGSGAWKITVDQTGALHTVAVTESDPQTGTIFAPPKYVPPFTQPAGPNGEVYPQQGQGSALPYDGKPFEIGTGMFTFSCGHWSNHLEVKSCSVGGVTAALICCPLCALVQRIVIPYEMVNDYSNFILFP